MSVALPRRTIETLKQIAREESAKRHYDVRAHDIVRELVE
jgi:hypothetical protein